MSTGPLKDSDLEAYASGRIAWAELRDRGVTYADVVAGLGRLGLRQPLASLEGLNLAARQRGIALLKDRLGSGR